MWDARFGAGKSLRFCTCGPSLLGEEKAGYLVFYLLALALCSYGFICFPGFRCGSCICIVDVMHCGCWEGPGMLLCMSVYIFLAERDALMWVLRNVVFVRGSVVVVREMVGNVVGVGDTRCEM